MEISPENPETHTGLRLTPPQEVAAGIPAVLATAKHLLEHPGLIKGVRMLRVMNQQDGFDCTSCAWPDPQGERSIAEFCENGAKAAADEGTRRRVDPEFFARHSVAELSQQSDHWLNAQGRLTHPMVWRPGATHYAPISWQEAFGIIGEHHRKLSSPEEAVFYTSGRTSNEAAFLYQLMVRKFGTNNLPDCSNMCHESSGFALLETIGIGKGTVKLEDFYCSELIIVLGQNPGTNHPRMLSALEKAKQNGAFLISVNPLPEAGLTRFKNPQDFMHPIRAVQTLLGSGTTLADLHVSVRVNGDVPFLKGVMKAVLERGAVDREFVDSRTLGFCEFATALEALDWEPLVEGSGVSRRLMEQVAEKVASSRRIICCWAMGLTQHANAVANIQELVNLILMRGAIGKPGAGLCPVRGHSNVQGDRTMGIVAWPKEPFLQALEKEFSFSAPRSRGLDTVGAIQAMHVGRVRTFVAMGGNFLSATPDTRYTAEGLQKLDLTAQVSTKLNRSHLITGKTALILPCLGRSELDLQHSGPQFVTVENSMGIVHSSRGRMEPASPHLMSEPAIVAGLAGAILGEDWSELAADYDRIRSRISRVIPGFEDYNARAREPDGFYLPNGPREGRFLTESGKAHLTVHPLPRWDLREEEFLMMTIRTHDQFNTTIYGLDDRYRGIHGERRVVLLNPDDMARRGWKSGDALDLSSSFGGRERSLRGLLAVSYPIPAGCAATYFPEANPLVPIESVADKSNCPTSKSVVVKIVPAGTGRL